MSGRRAVLALVVGLVACQTVVVVPAGPAPPTAPPPNEPALIRDFAELANAHRKKIGCPVLVWDERIAAVAQSHSDDMLKNNFFDHKNPRGQDAFARLDAAGVRFTAAAENIAFGQNTATDVLNGWLGSPGHRRNLDNCRYTRHGVGLAGTRWTHVFVGDR